MGQITMKSMQEYNERVNHIKKAIERFNEGEFELADTLIASMEKYPSEYECARTEWSIG